MYIKRYFNYQILYFISWRMVLYSMFTGLLAISTYRYLGWHWVAIPWLPVSLIGTAVAFYVGFKNNQSYDRNWEARKVWGGIVNLSRAFSASVRAFVTNTSAQSGQAEQEKKVLIYRHIAWLYALRHGMWQRTSWEHDTAASRRQRKYFEKVFGHLDMFDEAVVKYLSPEEQQWIQG